MEDSQAIRCRVAACREDMGDTSAWSFYIINDTDVQLDSAVLYQVASEWGDFGHTVAADVRITGLAPGAHALLWRDDGELRTELSLRVQASGRAVQMRFEFPRLYNQRDLQVVDGLGKPGWQEAAGSRHG